MKANIVDLMMDRSLVVCAKCGECLSNEDAPCPNRCYEVRA